MDKREINELISVINSKLRILILAFTGLENVNPELKDLRDFVQETINTLDMHAFGGEVNRYIPMPKENNICKGFFEHGNFVALKDTLKPQGKGD